MATPQAQQNGSISRSEKLLNLQVSFARRCNHKPACARAKLPNAECSCGLDTALLTVKNRVDEINAAKNLNSNEKRARKREIYEALNGRWATHHPTCKRMQSEISDPNIAFRNLPDCSCGFFDAQRALAEDLRKA